MLRSVVTLFAALLPIVSATSAHAERFMGLLPNDRIGNVHGKFPNAVFRDLKPAWLQPHQRLVQITGSGIDGELTIEFSHEIDSMAALLKGVAQKQANRVELTSVEVLVLRDWPGRLESLRQSPPPDPWKVRNIRWSPPKAVPIRQVLERFGTPEKDGTDEQFRRVLEWPRRGAMAYVSSDESVDLFVFEFTIGDHFCGSFWQHGRPCDPLNPAASVPKAVDPQIKESDVTQKRVSP